MTKPANDDKHETVLGIQKPTGSYSLQMVMISPEEYEKRIAEAEKRVAEEILDYIKVDDYEAGSICWIDQSHYLHLRKKYLTEEPGKEGE